MKITTKDIIVLLPFKEEFKKQLLSRFDSMTIGEKYEIEKILWDAYDAYFQTVLDKNLEEAMEKAKRNEIPLDGNFYKTVEEHTEKEVAEKQQHTKTGDALEAVRDKLQTYIQPQP